MRLKSLTNCCLLLVMLMLAACGGDAAIEDSGFESAGSDNSAETESQSTTIERVRLDEEHSNAASVQTQLAVGIIQLEDSDQAVDEALATEILPLWQALQALGQNETTATAELTAVLNQIQDTMQPEQINAIRDLQITEESIQQMLADGAIQPGRGGGGGQNGGAPAGGQGGQGGNGGGRGGLPGGGQGGQGGLGGADPDEIATRRAERFGEAGAGDFPGNAVTGAVVRLLSVKTGEEIVRQQGGPGQGNEVQTIITQLVSQALGITEDELNTKLDDGAIYADLIAEADIDKAALRSDLESALADTQLAQRGNLDETMNRLFGEE